MKTYHILVNGRVQGVGFRNFVVRTAHKYNALGWVRNLTSEEVEIMVQIKPADLDRFCQEIKRGPTLSSVTEFIIEEVKTNEMFGSFEKINDGSIPYETKKRS
jgi:acylphosphatase